ncbi:hypothetical protein [Actinoplanes sp. NPDC051851]|uniref:hypothetical protein n=1 Tax=Actinoplanes sp. NPDC051851 TaxID=3154753 RepID=UPI00343CFCC8
MRIGRMRKSAGVLALLVTVSTGVPGTAVAAPAVHPATVTPENWYVGGGSTPGRFTVYYPTSTITGIFSNPPAYNEALFSPTSNQVYLMGPENLMVFHNDTYTVGQDTPLTGTSNIVSSIISPDGQTIYAVDDANDAVYTIDTSTYTVSQLFTLADVTRGVSLSQDGAYLYVIDTNDYVFKFDSTSGAQVGSAVQMPGPVGEVTRSSNGSRTMVPIPAADMVLLFDFSTGISPIGSLTTSTGGLPNWAGYSPNGKWIFVVGQNGMVWKFEATGGALISSLDTHLTGTFHAAFNPNGTKLYLVPENTEVVHAIDLDDTVNSVGTLGSTTPLSAGVSGRNIAVGGSTEPAPPTIIGLFPGPGQVSVQYLDGHDGNDAITAHTVSWSGGSQACTGNPCTITGVPVGQQTFTMTSTNSFGPSQPSGGLQETIPGSSSASVPDAPTITSAVAGDGQVTLRFRDGSGNGSPITGHLANFSGGPAFCAASPCVISGLTNGTGYTFTVQAVNAVGNSSPSVASETVTPGRLPEAPKITGLQATSDGVKVSFTPPHSDTPIVKYQSQVDSGAWADLMAATIPGVKPGKHAVKVRAVNGVGAGPASGTAWVTVPGTSTKPDAVPAPMVVAAASSARLSWKKSSSEGVTGYTVRANPGPASCTTTADDTDCVIGGTAGTSYRYAVTVNGGGGSVSDPSAWSKSVTLKSPGLPSKLPGDAEPLLTTPKGKITSAVRGQKLTLIGSGFAAYSTVRIVIYGKARQLATVVTDAKGRLSKQITVPAELVLGQKHTVMAAGVDPDGAARRISMTFAVNS